jgi:hypothetical protein
MKSQRSEVGKMRWRSTETPSFSGAAGSEPAIVEVFDALDRDGNIVAAITKSVDGTIAFTVDGEEVGSATVDSIVGITGTLAEFNTAITDANIPVVSDVAYDATTWNGNLDTASKNALRDKFETLVLGGGAWGGITGTLADQTDLQTALDAKVGDTGNENIGGNKTFTGDTTFSGNVTFSGTGTNVSVWDTAKLDADHEYHGDVIAGLNAGATIAQFEAVYVGGSSTWLLADANGSGTYPAVGLAVAAYVDTNPAQILIKGLVRDDTWNWTIGGLIYLSATPGALTQTAPSTSGDKIQVVGRALTADIALFNFTSDYLTVT